MTSARSGDDAGTYVDVSDWTNESSDLPSTEPTEPSASTASTPTSAGASVPTSRRRRRRPWLFGLLGVGIGLAIVAGVYNLGGEPPADMPPNHPPIDAAAAAPATPVPLTPEEMAALKAKVDAAPDSKDDRLVYGVALYNAGEYGPAEEQWLTAADLDTADPGPWYNLGFLYLSLDPPADDKAEAAWRKVVELAPGTSMADTVTAHLERLDTLPTTPDPTITP